MGCYWNWVFEVLDVVRRLALVELGIGMCLYKQVGPIDELSEQVDAWPDPKHPAAPPPGFDQRVAAIARTCR